MKPLTINDIQHFEVEYLHEHEFVKFTYNNNPMIVKLPPIEVKMIITPLENEYKEYNRLNTMAILLVDKVDKNVKDIYNFLQFIVEERRSNCNAYPELLPRFMQNWIYGMIGELDEIINKKNNRLSILFPQLNNFNTDSYQKHTHNNYCIRFTEHSHMFVEQIVQFNGCDVTFTRQGNMFFEKERYDEIVGTTIVTKIIIIYQPYNLQNMCIKYIKKNKHFTKSILKKYFNRDIMKHFES